AAPAGTRPSPIPRTAPAAQTPGPASSPSSPPTTSDSAADTVHDRTHDNHTHDNPTPPDSAGPTGTSSSRPLKRDPRRCRWGAMARARPTTRPARVRVVPAVLVAGV